MQTFEKCLEIDHECACIGVRKGTNRVSTNGATAIVMVFDGGTFGVLPLTNCYIPKSARAYLFPQSVKMYYFCSGPISVDPICPQPITITITIIITICSVITIITINDVINTIINTMINTVTICPQPRRSEDHRQRRADVRPDLRLRHGLYGGSNDDKNNYY